MIEVFTDGGAQPNPGIGAWSFVIIKDGALAHSASGFAGNPVTNNYCEYMAMFNAFLYLQLNPEMHMDDSDIYIRSDSELMIKQIRGEYKVNKPELKKFREMIMSIGKLIFDKKPVHIEWNSRETDWTKICDGLCDSEITKAKLMPVS